MDSNIISAIVGAVIGGGIGVVATLLNFFLMRRQTALDIFASEVINAASSGGNSRTFGKESSQRISAAVVLLQPYLSKIRFSECLAMAKKYKDENSKELSMGDVVDDAGNPRNREQEALAFVQSLIDRANGDLSEDLRELGI